MELSVVIVTWNSAAHLEACIRALDGALPPPSEIVVVDNASTDGTASLARGLGARVLENTTNEGFGAACNRGARESTGNVLLFLNPDCVVQPGAVKAARRALVAAPRTGAVGAQLVDERGAPQPSADEFITPVRFLRRIARVTYGRGGPMRSAPDGPVDWVFGAFLLVRRDAFEEIRGFDAGFHLYYEDMDLCRRLWDAGWQVRFAADARAVHLGGASAALRWDGFPGREKARSLLRYERKHAGGAQTSAFRAAAAAAYGAYGVARAASGVVRGAGPRGGTPYFEMASVFARGED